MGMDRAGNPPERNKRRRRHSQDPCHRIRPWRPPRQHPGIPGRIRCRPVHPASYRNRPSQPGYTWSTSQNTSITQPIELGLFEDGGKVLITILRRNILIGGTTGAGKSGIVNVILAVLIACRDVEIWGVDMKGGMELAPWAACLTRIA